MNNIKQYHNIQVMTSDRVRLVIMLCEGVLKFNKSAEKAIEKGDIEGRSNAINRSIAIVSELSNSLNMEQGGEIAHNLSRLYDFSIEQLTAANRNNSTVPIDAVTRVFNELKAGWEGIATDKPKPASQAQARSISYGI